MKAEKTGVKRIIKSNETKYGNLSEFEKEKARFINENPTFDPKTKQYKYIKNIKTNTANHGWIFEFNGRIFAALQVWVPRMGETVYIFNATQKGDFSIDKENELVKYSTYVDIEAAVDKFVTEFSDI